MLASGLFEPLSTGTPADTANARAVILSPSLSRISGVGPQKVMPARSQARARSGFSDRNP